jgi:hypothetical protein
MQTTVVRVKRKLSEIYLLRPLKLFGLLQIVAADQSSTGLFHSLIGDRTQSVGTADPLIFGEAGQNF